MNPFDFRGPQFLAFYIVFAIVVIVAGVRVLRWCAARIAGDLDPRAITDPYLIACLRNGAAEAIRVATAALIDRGLLAFDGINVKMTDLGKNTRPRRELERKILAHCETPRVASTLPHLYELLAECSEWEVRDPDRSILRLRKLVFLVVAAVLIAVSAAKIVIALERGRTNVGYLIVLTFFACAIASHNIGENESVRAGRRLVNDLRNLFDSLRLRARELQPGGSSAEVALLAAVFGVTELPFPWAQSLFPPPPKSDSVSYASGGSSGSDSSSSSCGSSCGGGCGGGCGGCGS